MPSLYDKGSFALPPRRRGRPKLKPQEHAPKGLRKGRVVAVFGPPMSGVSLLIRGVHEESKQATRVIDAKGMVEDSLSVLVSLRREEPPKPDVIFLDGFPSYDSLNPSVVQWLYDERLVTPHDGALIRVQVGRRAVIHRLEEAHVTVDEAFHERWAKFESALPAVEERIRLLSMPYFIANNDELDVGFGDLARRAGIWE